MITNRLSDVIEEKASYSLYSTWLLSIRKLFGLDFRCTLKWGCFGVLWEVSQDLKAGKRGVWFSC